jgi:hypothetical protein
MTRYRYDTKNYYRYQSIRPLLTKSLRGLLLGVGDGRKGRIGTGILFLPTKRSGSGEVVSAGTFLEQMELKTLFGRASAARAFL